ncbi:NAD(P)/FAD-dependent oxidoreductase [Limnohabitans sp. B9-3]|uniref:NAD(P)/FAD-dependent oxidoreductase n=1 Tax=Limnohabitans sp. B9-3 TaxID=1100707 RepID=UPI000C1E106E|nr:NAD(P)/FAD-dependent oxidoreductase [Limnohabitans sp. B9-3]PIT73640.1 ferredoxin--NADP(+) reductase [Limnohabitans sp. B9-3]
MSALPIHADAVIVGAGPVGLFQAFQLGLQDIRCHIIDALPHAGGQCMELYPDKPIYDIPGIPLCTGRELVAQLQTQIKPFAPTFHLNQEVTEVTRLDNGLLAVHTSADQHFVCKVLVIAAGVGAFQARKLAVDGAPALEGTQVHYRLGDTSRFTGQDVVVLGGEESAVVAALQLIHASQVNVSTQSLTTFQAPRSVTLMHRRDVFTADPVLLQAMRDAVADESMQLQIGQPTGLLVTDGRLHALQIATPDGSTVERPAQQLVALLGLSPKLGPIANWGLAMERKQLVVNTETFATDVPGIFAVGDINTYPGKKKLILCGFHEATLAAFGAAAIVHPTRKTLLQYTTTSTELHRLLGLV